MKLVTYRQNRQLRVGAVRPDGIIDLSKIAPDMLSLIDAGPTALARACQRIDSGAEPIPLDSVKLLAPIPLPRRNIICLGHNYAEHAKESDEARGNEYRPSQPPTFFTKATHAANGPYDDIPFDASISEQIDWEAELGVVIGRSGKNIPLEHAMDYVLGYVAINDISARDLQFLLPQNNQFFKGKSLDGTCPMGPWIVTADEIPDPQHLQITCRVNGVIKQAAETSLMISNIPQIISILSRGMTLDAGDVIATGTPSGVGFARKPPEFLKPGDIVEVEIERIGLLRNRVSGT